MSIIKVTNPLGTVYFILIKFVHNWKIGALDILHMTLAFKDWIYPNRIHIRIQSELNWNYMSRMSQIIRTDSEPTLLIGSVSRTINTYTSPTH